MRLGILNMCHPIVGQVGVKIITSVMWWWVGAAVWLSAVRSLKLSTVGQGQELDG